jgi:hypothetical protein
MEKETAIVKFNNGNLAILCSKCRFIIKTGKDFSEEELLFVKGELDLPPQYCEDFENCENYKKNKI